MAGEGDDTGPRPVRIVVVDDDAQMREVVTMALETRPGFVVAATAETGEDGVVAVDEHQPDVVLIDLAMPGRGGQWAVGEMLARHPGLPIVVVSAHVGRTLERELTEAGVAAVLRKGGGIAELLDTVTRALEQPR